jgi:hypothetical protein
MNNRKIMGKNLLIIAIMGLSLLGSAQEKLIITQIDTTGIFLNPTVKAVYPTGSVNLKRFVKSNIDTSIYEKYYNSFKKPEGFSYISSVFVQCKVELIVDTSGKLYNISINTKSPQFIKDEITKLLLLSQPWKPALENNSFVKSKKTFDLEFAINFTREFRKKYFSTHPTSQ